MRTPEADAEAYGARSEGYSAEGHCCPPCGVKKRCCIRQTTRDFASRNMLQCFRHIGLSRHPPKNARSFSAYRAVPASAEKCSCIFGMSAIHGRQKKTAG